MAESVCMVRWSRNAAQAASAQTRLQGANQTSTMVRKRLEAAIEAAGGEVDPGLPLIALVPATAALSR